MEIRETMGGEEVTKQEREIVDNVNRHINQSGKTIEEIAGRVGVSPPTIYSRMKPSNGRCCSWRLSELLKVAKALEIGVVDLISEQQDLGDISRRVEALERRLAQ